MSEAVDPDVLPPVSRVSWEKHYRLVPSRFPPINLFERIADPADWETVAAIEGRTNDRLRDEIGEIAIVPAGERIAGPGASVIMAAFTHIGRPSRFTDGSFGVYYACHGFQGALREVFYHRARFLSRTREPKCHFDWRTYVGAIDADLHDIRKGWDPLHLPDSYAESQAMGKRVKTALGNGLVYRSVRSEGDENIAILRPRVLAAARPGQAHTQQGVHVRAEWDGQKMTRYITMGRQGSWTSLE